MYLGDTINLHAVVSDANPSDSVLMTLHLQAHFSAHPSGLVVVSEQARPNHYSLQISWTPLVRDTGKTTRMCLESEGQRFNPSRPSQIYASLPISRCINVYVPSCQVRVKLGDTLRSLGQAYQVPWRTLFIINPSLSQAGDGLMTEGQVVRIGRHFRLRSPRDMAYAYSIENASSVFSVAFKNIYNHNAAAVFRLSAPGAMTCASGEPPETCALRSQVDPARHVVSDVRFSTLAQSERYEDSRLCLVARFHSNCL